MKTLSPEYVESLIAEKTFYYHKLMTICVLELNNGYLVTGQSACAHEDMYDSDIGDGIALENAIRNIWPLAGYMLKQSIFEHESNEAAEASAA